MINVYIFYEIKQTQLVIRNSQEILEKVERKKTIIERNSDLLNFREWSEASEFALAMNFN